jgi:hypothetical protein
MRGLLSELLFGDSNADDVRACQERETVSRGQLPNNPGVLWRTIARALSPAALLAVAIPSLALGQINNEGLPVIPVQIVNNYNTAQSLYVFIYGTVAQATNTIPAGKWVYVTNVQGDIAQTPVVSHDVFQSLAVNIGAAQSTTIYFPKISGRMYVSVGQGLQTCCIDAIGNPPTPPAGWNSSEPNYNTPFDWVEPTWDNAGNAGLGHTTRMNINTTQVDMYGLSMFMKVQGKSTLVNQPAILNSGFFVRPQVIQNAYQKLGMPWTTLVVSNANVPFRVMAPYLGILPPNEVFPSTEMDSYIADVWAKYASGSGNSISVTHQCDDPPGTPHNQTFTGSVTNGNLVFSENGTPRFQFPQPTTLQVYENAIKANPQPTGLYGCQASAVAAQLGAAMVRTNLLVNNILADPVSPACVKSGFYVNAPIQRYSQIFHTYAVNNLAYSFGYDDVCHQSSFITIDDPTSMTIAVGGEPLLNTHDFNGDGFSDIAWRDASGNTAVWLMNGATVMSTGSVGAVPTTWSIVGQRDFNSDGNADLLWRDTSGNTAIWFVNGTQVASTASLGNIPITWNVAATGDFDGNGFGDILWRDGSGNLAVWTMGGNGGTAATVAASGSLGNVPSTWAIVGAGDFNGDGKTDLLWRDNLGNTSIWFLSSNSQALAAAPPFVSSAANLGNIPTTWSVVGTGDFNGDGMADIAWQDTSGNTAIWLMNGATVLSTGSLGLVPTTTTLALTGDFNGDGVSDLLWRDTSGNTSIWFMSANGTTVTVGSTALVGTIPTTWSVQNVNAE